MAGIGSVVPLLTAGTNIAALNQKSRAASADDRLAQQQFDYQRQQDELRRQQEAAALVAAQEAENRKYAESKAAEERRIAAEQAAREYQAQLQREAEQRQAAESKAAEERRLAAEQAAREYQAQLQRESEQRAWEREERLRREDAAAQAAAQAAAEAAAKQEAEERRRLAAEVMANAHNSEYQQLLNRQNEEWSSVQTSADTQVQQIRQSAAADEAERQAALKRSQATARAKLGAGGVGAQDGSGRAVLLGQQAAKEAQTAARTQTDQSRLQAIQADLDNRRRVNLLAQAELAERQRLEYLNKFYG